MEKIIGHMTFVSLIRRELLSILSAVYQFAQLPPGRHRIHENVRKELQQWCALAPLAWVNLRKQYHSR
eukprot:6320284-Amphidinium_carterae.1